MSERSGLGLLAMTALVVGSLIGSGIFSLPQNMAEGAAAGPIVIAWSITFVGMLALTRLFQWLALNGDGSKDGIYGYARSGFGEFVGFCVAWGYWISVWLTNVSYLVVLFSALGAFPGLGAFGEGDSGMALAGGLTLLWTLHGFILFGIRSAALLNVIVTIAKLLPIAVFLICAALYFELDTFRMDFWGRANPISMVEQIESTMLYTVFVFLGIESATVYANRARSGRVVSRATLFGFLLTFALLLSVSLLSLGVAPQAELADMRNPSMAAVMELIVGPWGGVLINIGLVVSVGGALLAWMLISSEMLYIAARGSRHTAPGIFGRLNRHGTPANALWLTNALVSLFLLINYVNDAGYNLFIQLAASMALLPYLICALFALRLALRRRKRAAGRLALAMLGTLYGVWLIFAGGLYFLLLSTVLYSAGIPLYLQARRERQLPLFGSRREGPAALLLLALGVLALQRLLSGGNIT